MIDKILIIKPFDSCLIWKRLPVLFINKCVHFFSLNVDNALRSLSLFVNDNDNSVTFYSNRSHQKYRSYFFLPLSTFSLKQTKWKLFESRHTEKILFTFSAKSMVFWNPLKDT